MAPKGKKAQTKKVKKKRWIPILAPKLFNNTILGETHIADPAEVAKKTITLNLMTVMNDMRKQGYQISFSVTGVKDLKAETAVTALTMTPSAMKRQIRRGRTKVDDSFLAKLSDGRQVRVKPTVITANRCSKDAQTEMRLAVREKLKAILKATTLEAFVQEVIETKVQRLLKEIAQKNHPIRTVEIRSVGYLPGDKAVKASV